MTSSSGSSFSNFVLIFDIFNFKAALAFLFFLEFEVLLSIVHPILLVDFLEHINIAAILLTLNESSSGDIIIYLLFFLSSMFRPLWNNIFETLFVRLLAWDNLQLLSSLELELRFAGRSTILGFFSTLLVAGNAIFRVF